MCRHLTLAYIRTHHMVHLVGCWFKHQIIVTLNAVSREVHLSQYTADKGTATHSTTEQVEHTPNRTDRTSGDKCIVQAHCLQVTLCNFSMYVVHSHIDHAMSALWLSLCTELLTLHHNSSVSHPTHQDRTHTSVYGSVQYWSWPHYNTHCRQLNLQGLCTYNTYKHKLSHKHILHTAYKHILYTAL